MNLKRYKVTVQRCEYYAHTFEVEASSRGLACAKSMDMAGDYDFHEALPDSAKEEVVAIEEVK